MELWIGDRVWGIVRVLAAGEIRRMNENKIG